MKHAFDGLPLTVCSAMVILCSAMVMVSSSPPWTLPECLELYGPLPVPAGPPITKIRWERSVLAGVPQAVLESNVTWPPVERGTTAEFFAALTSQLAGENREELASSSSSSSSFSSSSSLSSSIVMQPSSNDALSFDPHAGSFRASTGSAHRPVASFSALENATYTKHVILDEATRSVSIISHSNRFTRANETSVPQTWCSAPST